MEKELRTNAKTLSPEEQYQIRKSIVRLNKTGKSNEDIAEVLDVSERHVRNVKKIYAEQGIAGIKPKLRGRKTGEQRTLTPEQEMEIRHLIVDKNPEQLRLPGCMWTRENIRELIREKYKIEMPLSTLGYYSELIRNRSRLSRQNRPKNASSAFSGAALPRPFLIKFAILGKVGFFCATPGETRLQARRNEGCRVG